MASTFTITATAQPAMTPPSVKLVVTQSGTPALSSVTVNRTDAAGNVFPVRTSDGDVLAISGGTATVFDPEAPYGQLVTYTVAANNTPTATATLTAAQVWLVHLGKPRISIPIELAATGAGDISRPMSQAAYPILGSAFPIVISGGARTAAAQTLTVLTDTLAALAGLRTVLADGCPLLLNVPPSLGIGLDSNYIAVGAVSEKRSPLGIAPQRWTDLSTQVIGRPFGAAQAPLIYTDLTYSSWSAIPAGTTWTQLLS